jgi:hypothetical protein
MSRTIFVASKAWLARGVIVATLLVAAINHTACSRPERGQLMLSFSTDMDVNADVGAVGLSISLVGGKSLTRGIYPVKFDPGTKRYTPELPSTLAVVSNGESSESVRVQLVAYKDADSKKVLGLREVVSQVPLKNFRTTRVPVTWLSGVRFNQSPETLGSRSNTSKAAVSNLASPGLNLSDSVELVDPLVRTGCSEQEVFTASGCKPIVDDELSKGAEGAPNQASACLDVNACYNNSVTGWAKSLVFEVDNGSAKKCFALIPNPTAKLNLGIATEREVGAANPAAPAVGFSVSAASNTRRVVPLGRNQPFEGWTTTTLRVDDATLGSARNKSLAGDILARYRGENVAFPELAPAVCDAILSSNDVQYLYATAACDGVSETLQPCTNGNPAKAVQPVDASRATVVSNDAKSASLFGMIPNGPPDAGAGDGSSDSGSGTQPTEVAAGLAPESAVAVIGQDLFMVTVANGETRLSRVDASSGSVLDSVSLPGLRAGPMAPLRVRAFANDPTSGLLVVWVEAFGPPQPAAIVPWQASAGMGERLSPTSVDLRGFIPREVLRAGDQFYFYGGSSNEACLVLQHDLKMGTTFCAKPGAVGEQVTSAAEFPKGNGKIVLSVISAMATPPANQSLWFCQELTCESPQVSSSDPIVWFGVAGTEATPRIYWRTLTKFLRGNLVNDRVDVGGATSFAGSFPPVFGGPNALNGPRATFLQDDFIYGDFGNDKGVERFSLDSFDVTKPVVEAFPSVGIGQPTSFAVIPANGMQPARLAWTELVGLIAQPNPPTARLLTTPLK